MSDAYHFTRLRWHDGHGIAKLHGVVVTLTEAPDLGSGQVAEVDYSPAYGCREVRRHSWDRRDDMTAAEIAAADALLRKLCAVEGD